MKAIKSFDLFQKVTVDYVAKPTLLGAFLTISTIILMIYLFYKEINDLYIPILRKESLVIQDRDKNSVLKVNIMLKFPNTPCYIISVNYEDEIGNQLIDISEGVVKKTLNKDGSLKGYMKKDYLRSQEEIITKALDEEEGCLISGGIEINKVPGNINISFNNKEGIYDDLKQNYKKYYDKLFLNHYFSIFNFGDHIISNELVKKFGQSVDYLSFNNKLADYSNFNSNSSYEYYIKLIPHIFQNSIDNKTTTEYQYSVTSRIRHTHNEIPHIIINYDFTPITMKIILESKDILSSLTHLLAIVGGIFVIFSIINNILFGLLNLQN